LVFIVSSLIYLKRKRSCNCELYTAYTGLYSRPKSVARSGPPLATLLTRVHGEENHRSATGHKHIPLNYSCMVTAL